jgi:gliding motility-associated lipoprotein GldD
MSNHFLLYLFILALFSCNEVYTPKPKGYFKIDYPEKKYVVFNEPGYPYSFEYPVYGNVLKDSTFFDTLAENPYWVNVDFPEFGARFHLSYKPINKKEQINLLIQDAFKMTGKHSIKASYIDEIPLKEGPGKYGFIFDVGGNAATGKQFYITDSSHHFIRGALYFEATPNFDSISPSEQFLYKDMQHMIKTLQWKN